MTRRFIPPRQFHDLGLALVPQRQVLEHLLDMPGIGRLSEQAAAEADGGDDALEGVGVELLRNESDLGSRRPIIADDVVAVDLHLAAGGVTIPQTMLIRVVLPAPLGPSRAKISPRAMSRLTPFSASCPPASAWKPAETTGVGGAQRSPLVIYVTPRKLGPASRMGASLHDESLA
jgi:hypothetical protein